MKVELRFCQDWVMSFPPIGRPRAGSESMPLQLPDALRDAKDNHAGELQYGSVYDEDALPTFRFFLMFPPYHSFAFSSTVMAVFSTWLPLPFVGPAICVGRSEKADGTRVDRPARYSNGRKSHSCCFSFSFHTLGLLSDFQSHAKCLS